MGQDESVFFGNYPAILKKQAMKLITHLTMLLLFSISATGQKGAVKWTCEYKQLGWCGTRPPSFQATFYEDSTFEYRTQGWGAGRGTYEIVDSIIICTYNGEAPGPALEKGWVEIRYSAEGKKGREVIVLDRDGREPFFGAEVSFLSADGTLIETSITDFDGRSVLPKAPFYKVSVAYIGYQKGEAFVSPGFSGDLIFCLAKGREELVIAKEVRHTFRVRKIAGQEVILEPVELGRQVFFR